MLNDQRRNRMTTDSIKNLISEKTGVPAEMLTGETPEENITRARQLLAFKRENSAQVPADPGKQFASWIRSQTGETEKTENPEVALENIAEQLRIESGGYPKIQDAGNPYINGVTAPDPRSGREIFKEWFYKEDAFDPFSDNGWKPL